MILNRIVVIAALLLSINVFAKAEKISYENGKKIYMAKCVSCHGVDGQKMTPWKFHDRGHKRFEDILTHSVFIHNDINRKTIPKVLQEYGLSENQLKIKLNHVDGFNIKHFLAEEFSYEDSTTNSLVYIIFILIVLAILLKYYNNVKKKKEQARLLAEAKRNGFDSVGAYEAKKAGFNSEAAHKAHLNKIKRKNDEERRKKQEEQKERIQKEKVQMDNAPKLIIKAQYQPPIKAVWVTTKQGDNEGKFTIPAVVELINWTSNSITVRRDANNKKLITTHDTSGKQIDQYIER